MLTRAHILQLTAGAMLALAVVMVHSAGMSITQQWGGPVDATLGVLSSRHTLFAALAILTMLAVSQVNIRHALTLRTWRSPIAWAFVIALGLVALTQVPGIAREANGASRWLWIGAGPVRFSFQPSELLKWVMIPTLALWCTRRGAAMHRPFVGLLPALVILGLASAAIVIEDLGTGVLVGAVGFILLIAGGARIWQMMLILPVGATAGYFAIANSPWRLARIMAFLDPWQDPDGIGYHPIQSMVAIAQGGIAGRGLGNGIQKFGYLPEDTTDFLFAIICEELGLVGALAVVAAYLVILVVGLGVVRECRDTFGRLVALGVLLTVGLQATANLMVVAVMIPTKGIALPLLSAGGTGWIMTAAAIGALAALDKANQLEREFDLELIDDGQPGYGAYERGDLDDEPAAA